jgi:WD40 repeat protein
MTDDYAGKLVPSPRRDLSRSSDLIGRGRVLAKSLAAERTMRSVPRPVTYLMGHQSPVGHVTFTSDSQGVLTLARDNTLRCWRLPDGEEVDRVSVNGYLRKLVLSSNDERLALPLQGLALCPHERGAFTQEPYNGRLLLGAIFPSFALRPCDCTDHLPWAAAFAPTGDEVVVGGSDGFLSILDAHNGIELKRFSRGVLSKQHDDIRGDIHAVVFTPDGATVVAGDTFGYIRVWEAATGRLLRHLAGPGPRINGLAILPDRWLLVTDAEAIRVLTLEGDEVYSLPAPWQTASAPERTSLVVAPGGQFFLVRVEDDVSVHDSRTGHVKVHLAAPSSWRLSSWRLNDIALSNDGRKIASAEGHSVLEMWDNTGHLRRKVKWHEYFVHGRHLAFAPTGQYLFSGHQPEGVLHNLESGEQELLGPRVGLAHVKAVDFCSDARRLLIYGLHDVRRQRAITWDLVDQCVLHDCIIPVTVTRRRVLSPDGHLMAVLNSIQNAYAPIQVIRLNDGKQLPELRPPKSTVEDPLLPHEWITRGNEVEDVHFSPTGSHLLSTHRRAEELRLWCIGQTDELYHHSGPPQTELQSGRFAPDGRTVLGAWGNPDFLYIGVWDVVTGAEVASFASYDTGADTAKLAPDGEHVLFYSQYSADILALWNIRTQREVVRYEGYAGIAKVYDCASNLHRRRGVWFTPDGRYILVHGHDGMLRVWDVISGEEHFCVEEPDVELSEDVFERVAFTADGQQLHRVMRVPYVTIWEV